ncbi:MAG: hypothetical protein AABY61_09315 [Nitrospirota bacterium]
MLPDATGSRLVLSRGKGRWLVWLAQRELLPATKSSGVSEGHGDNEGRPQYVDDDICHDPLHDNKLVAVYAAAVWKEGRVDGTIIGVLGVVFDWETQSQIIVQNEAFISEASWKRTRVMLLDNDLRIIAASDKQGPLQPFALDHQGRQRGYTVNGAHDVIAYARTIGYQEYDGLGWYGVIVRTPR